MHDNIFDVEDVSFKDQGLFCKFRKLMGDKYG